jgi:hypothetical protein
MRVPFLLAAQLDIVTPSRASMPTVALIVAVVVFFAISAFVIAKSRRVRPEPNPIVGGIYVTNPDEDHKIGVIKVLAIDRDGVHVSIYKNRFSTRPSHIEEAKLEFGTIHDSDPPGIMHVPLSNAAFTRFGPVFIQQSHVSAEELEPIKEWRRGGGYWP